MTWSLASYTAAGTQGFAVLREDGTLVAPPDLKRWPGPLELLEDWSAAEQVLRDLDVENAPAVEYDALLAGYIKAIDRLLVRVHFFDRFTRAILDGATDRDDLIRRASAESASSKCGRGR